MNEKDHEWQHRFESGKVSGFESDHANAYRHVFRALKKEPELELPDHFADAVVQKLAQQKTSLFREYFWLGTGIVMLLIASVIAVVMTGFKFDFGFLKAMSSYKGLFAFGIAAALIWNFLEKRLLKTRTF